LIGFTAIINPKNPGKKVFRGFRKITASVEYKITGWSLHPTKRRITFTDKKGIGEVKLLGKWEIHIYSVKSLKRVRIVKRADGFYGVHLSFARL